MRKLIFLFAVHNHQPVGNFDTVFKKAFKECYIPFLEAMARRPGIKFSLHFSGPLWEYMEAREKECWAMITDMTGRGQVELLSGGFYEPILALIPENDRQGQIRMMNSYLESHFGIKPRGLWLTERVWEPHLAASLARAGIRYTLLDEEHFHYAGIRNTRVPYITEDEGQPLVLFPVSKKLRYLIPFRSIEDLEAHFLDLESEDGMAILGDDGEKFGLWPGTHHWVYEEGWLETFLNFLENQGIRTMTFSDYLATRPSLNRAYLPPASYEEMMEWILEPDDLDLYLSLKRESPAEARRFLRGGFFREFLIKYPESNHLHKRMLLVSREAARHQGPDDAAVRHLYRGQGNDPYWHGVFGGLYLPHLREAAYSHLLEAEKRLPLAEGWRVEDYDLDGRDEVLYRGEDLNFFIKPSHGGAIVEIDDLGLSRNLSNVLSRRRESYHRPARQGPEAGRSIHELARELPAGHETLLRYDWHPRYSLLDHILHPRTTAEDFMNIRYGEQGDFVNQEYQFRLENDGGGAALSRSGHVWVDDDRKPVEIRKTVRVGPGQARFLYALTNPAAEDIGLFFANEWNLSLYDGEWDVEPAALSLLKGRWRVEFAPGPDGIWHFPLETLSQSENGYDIIRQGRCFLPYWRIRLGAGETILLTIQWTKKR